MDRYTVSVTPSGDSLLDQFMKQLLPPEIVSDGVTSVRSLNSIPEMKVRLVWTKVQQQQFYNFHSTGQSSTYPSEISQYSDVETNYFEPSPQESLYDDNTSGAHQSLSWLNLWSFMFGSLLITRVMFVERI